MYDYDAIVWSIVMRKLRHLESEVALDYVYKEQKGENFRNTQGFNWHKQSSYRIQVPMWKIIQQFNLIEREDSLLNDSKLQNIKDL